MTLVLTIPQARGWISAGLYWYRVRRFRNQIAEKRELCDVRGCKEIVCGYSYYYISDDETAPYFDVHEKVEAGKGRYKGWQLVFCGQHLSDWLWRETYGKSDSMNLDKGKIKFHNAYRMDHAKEYETLGGLEFIPGTDWNWEIKCTSCGGPWHSRSFLSLLNEYGRDKELYLRFLRVLLKPCERCGGESVISTANSQIYSDGKEKVK